METSYAIGADGYHSLVRRKLEIETKEMGPVQFFSVYEFTAEGELPDEARVFFDANGSGVYWPLGAGRCRFSFELPEEESQRLSESRLRELVRERARWFGAELREVYWSTAVRFERRLAEKFAVPRVFLAGDAVHLTSPIGAQSMNVGLKEAAEIARRIAEASRSRNVQEEADSYDANRREEWGRLLGLGGEPWGLPGADPWILDHREKILPAIAASGRDLETLLRQVGLSAGIAS
jgi:2-polyprenyl-6-methoxyphenol hydroxylase-like FAD-dependent oxidoreductase